MKKYLFAFVSLLFISSTYAAIGDSHVDKFFDEFYKPAEVYTYAKKNGTCSGVLTIDSFNKFKIYFSGYLDTNEEKLSTSFLSESQRKNYDTLARLQLKMNKIKKLNESLVVYKYSESQIKKISDTLDLLQGCGEYSGVDIKVCNILLQRKDIEKTLAPSDYLEYDTLLASKDSFSPKNEMSKAVLSRISDRIINTCSTILPNPVSPIKQSSEIKSLTDMEVTDFIKTVREKYKLMSKAQKEKFLKFLKEFK